MKVIISGLLSLFLLSGLQMAQAADVSALQLLFTVKKIFPEADEVNILLPRSILTAEEDDIKRAAALTKIQPVIFVVERNLDIGASIRTMSDGSVLIVFGDDLLSENNSKLFVLSKCKEKKISLVSSSKGYSDSGALLGVLKGTDKKVGLVLNLKHNKHLKARFTSQVVEEIGFRQVIN